MKDREFLFAGSDTRVASLILWHFVEEIEHKNVAFDAYQAMLKKDGLWSSFRSRWKLLKMIMRFSLSMLPPTVSACLPWHHPSEVKDPQWCLDWLEVYQSDDIQLERLDTGNLSAGFAV